MISLQRRIWRGIYTRIVRDLHLVQQASGPPVFIRSTRSPVSLVMNARLSFITPHSTSSSREASGPFIHGSRGVLGTVFVCAPEHVQVLPTALRFDAIGPSAFHLVKCLNQSGLLQILSIGAGGGIIAVCLPFNAPKFDLLLHLNLSYRHSIVECISSAAASNVHGQWT